MHHYAIDDLKKGWGKVMLRIGLPPGPARMGAQKTLNVRADCVQQHNYVRNDCETQLALLLVVEVFRPDHISLDE